DEAAQIARALPAGALLREHLHAQRALTVQLHVRNRGRGEVALLEREIEPVGVGEEHALELVDARGLHDRRERPAARFGLAGNRLARDIEQLLAVECGLAL